jgi:hypothetical protein
MEGTSKEACMYPLILAPYIDVGVYMKSAPLKALHGYSLLSTGHT